MSLINEMLNNLEMRRKHYIDTHNNIINDLLSTNQTYAKWLRIHYRWLLIGMIIALLLVYLVWPVPKKIVTPVIKQPVIIAAPVASAPKISPAAAIINTPDSISAPVQARIEAISVTGDFTHTILNIYLNKNVPYAISTDQAHNTLTLTLVNALLAEPLLPMNTHNTSIQDIQTSSDNNQLKIILTLANGTQMLRMQQNDNAPPQLNLELLNETAAVSANSSIPTTIPDNTALTKAPLNSIALDNEGDIASGPQNAVEKIPQPLTPEQQADQAYQKALDLIQSNRQPEAISTLKQLLAQMPSYATGREALVTLLIQQGQLQDATTIINQGLNLQPHYPSFAKLAAQIFMVQNQPAEALAVLQTATPALSEDPDYYAFMAALYQRLNQPMQAAKLYNQLVEQYPNNSLWWLGLGTTLEAMGKTKAALEAYQNASTNGNLNTQLQSFVDNRIKKLGG